MRYVFPLGPQFRGSTHRAKRNAGLLAATLSIGVVAGLLTALLSTPKPVSASTVTLTYTYSSYLNGATWTVPAGVTSITFDMRGGAGGKGGPDGRTPGSGGPFGRLQGTISVVQGNSIGIYPGGGGGNGSGCFSNASGGAGGRSSYSTAYNGGRGGNAGTSGCSGGGGGGGAASILVVGGVVQGVAAGAGGGGGANNVMNSGSGRGAAPQTNLVGGSTTTGNTTAGSGARGDWCGVSDGGGGGGGGGGIWAGAGGTVFRSGGECVANGGWRGDNQWAGTVLNSLPAGFTSSYTSSGASVISITYTLSITAPDLTAATDLGTSNTDNRTTWSTTTKPQFTGTASGGASITLGVNGSYGTNCGNANSTTGVYTCTWTPSSDGTYTITTRATAEGVTVTSSSLSVTIDTVRPTATLTRPAATVTSRTLTYTLGFSETIDGLAGTDFSNSGTATGCTFTPSAATGTSFTVAVTCTSDGTVVLTLGAGSVLDTAGNTGPATAASAASVLIDTVAPLPGLTAATINNSGSATVRSTETGTAYLVQNTVSVTNVASITGAAGDLWNSVSITQANTNTTLSATGLSEGTYVLYTVDGNGLLSDASTTTVVIDNTAPNATWTPPASPVRAWSFTYTLGFTEAISGLSSDDFSYTGTASGCSFSPSSTTGTTFTVSVTCTSDGTVVATLNANAVTDVATNAGPTGNRSATEITIDAELVVTYDSQLGSSIPSGLTMVGSSILSSPGTPDRQGYVFGGWAISAAGTPVTFPYVHGSNVDFTMYAIWTAIDLTVNFNSGGGSAVTSVTVKSNATLGDPGTPSRTGYTFTGWWTAASGGTKITFPYAHGQVTDFALYAQWNGNTLVVTFSTGTDGSAVANGETVSGGTLAAPATPTRSGFTFNGWSPLASGGSPVRFPYTHGRIANFTLYAIWRSDAEPNNVWFYPGAGRASLASLAFAPQTDNQNIMVPQFPRSTTTYEVSTTVTQPVGVEQIDTIAMCWFKSTREEVSEGVFESVAEPGVSDACENATASPETEMKAVWSQATNSFDIVGSSNHRLATSTSTYVAGATSMAITFKFNVSHAMRAGTWTVAVIVTDKAGAAQRQTLDATVAFTATSTTERLSQSFGPIAPGSSVTINDFPAGVFTANALAKLTISASRFKAGSVELNFAEGENTPTAGQVALDCSLGSVLSNPIRVPDAAHANTNNRVREFEERLNPTAEPQRIRRNMTCRLSYGGGASRSLVEYSSTVTFGVGAR
jgi:uncharacterized repeat protein (TIGR02543 family)